MAALIGHDQAEADFLDAWRHGRLHHAWLLAGPEGLGKGQFARRIARFLATRPSTAMDDPATGLDDPGDPAADRLVQSGNHPEILLLERAVREKAKGTAASGDLARNITVDQVRGVLRRLHLSIAIGSWRVILVDAIDDMEAEAANALLKTLEEPPVQTLFLLISHAPGRLLPTIRSRCRVLRFHPLDEAAMQAWLHQARPMMERREVEAIAAAARGVPGAALALLDSKILEMEKRLMAIASSGDPSNQLREKLARDVAGAAGRQRLELMLEVYPSILQRLAQGRSISTLAPLLHAWDESQFLAGQALRGSYDPAMIGFAVGNALAELAKQPAN